MTNLIKEYKNLFEQFPQNSNICIWGSNNIAKKTLEKLSKQRPDITVKFFIDSKVNGEINNIPIYHPENIGEHLNEIDSCLICSYSTRFYMQFILRAYGINKIVFITKEIVDLINIHQQPLSFNTEKTAKVFKTLKDRNLYRFLSKYRQNSSKYRHKLVQWFNKNNKELILDYSMKHYYEFTNNEAIEVAIDAGGYDGMHSLLNLQMFPNCKKVYMFEPCYESFKTTLLDKLIQSKPEIEIIKKALWKENTTIEFREEFDIKTGSSVVEAKPDIQRSSQIIEVDAITLDKFVEENNIERIDFIKMDLENAEMDALKGAEKTILKFRPQLAISIYHSNEHFYNLPLYLKDLLTNYDFRLGHYCDTKVETVLYAIPKELVK